jgi:hypothetical protein
LSTPSIIAAGPLLLPVMMPMMMQMPMPMLNAAS